MKNKAYNTIKNRIMEQRKSLEDLTNIADLDFAITELNEIDGMIELAQVLQVNQDLIDELKNEVATNFDIILKKSFFKGRCNCKMSVLELSPVSLFWGGMWSG